jgi:hypothetical protein
MMREVTEVILIKKTMRDGFSTRFYAPNEIQTLGFGLHG